MTIGEASRASGVSVKMIRHDEAMGRLPAPLRTGSDDRVYRTPRKTSGCDAV